MVIYSIIIILGHLVGFMVLTQLVLLAFRKRFAGDKARRITAAVAAVVLCAVYITGAFVNAFTLQRTGYELTTDKGLGRERLRVAQISDCHLGVNLSGERFGRWLDDIAACEPDVLVITGDLVDGDTTREDMLAACEALGRFDAPLGVYFVPGNHEMRRLRFDLDELISALEEKGVAVLEDEAVLVDDSFYICGRRDAYDCGRLDMDELLVPLDSEKYIIVLDHQPADYAAQSRSEADLVLSGHTHGGQMLPLALALRPMGFCDKVYGHSRFGDTDYIVTSGMGALKVPMRTGTPTEFVVIDIINQ